jgi:hypothetical protein
MIDGVNEIVAGDYDSSWPQGWPGETGPRMLPPDRIISAQYYRSPCSTPYQRLLLAVLEDAIRSFQRNLHVTSGPRRVVFGEVQQWLFDRTDTGFMSCSSVCLSLGIEPSLLRRCLRQWQFTGTRGFWALRGYLDASKFRLRAVLLRKGTGQSGRAHPSPLPRSLKPFRGRTECVDGRPCNDRPGAICR